MDSRFRGSDETSLDTENCGDTLFARKEGQRRTMAKLRTFDDLFTNAPEGVVVLDEDLCLRKLGEDRYALLNFKEDIQFEGPASSIVRWVFDWHFDRSDKKFSHDTPFVFFGMFALSLFILFTGDTYGFPWPFQGPDYDPLFLDIVLLVTTIVVTIGHFIYVSISEYRYRNTHKLTEDVDSIIHSCDRVRKTVPYFF